MKANSRILLCGLAAALMLISAACSTTRRIPEGEQLYTGLKGVVYTPDTARIVPEVSSAIHDAVDVPPNNYWKLLGWHYPFPLGLWVYNNWPNPKSGLRHWLYEKLARDPVLVSDVRPEARVKMIDGMLDDNGYFRGSTSYELLPGKNPRKAKIRYTVNPGPAFVIDSVELLPDTTHLTHLIDSLARTDRYLSSRTRRLAVGRTGAHHQLAAQPRLLLLPPRLHRVSGRLGDAPHPHHPAPRPGLQHSIVGRPPLPHRTHHCGDKPLPWPADTRHGGDASRPHPDTDAAHPSAPADNPGVCHIPQRTRILGAQYEPHPDLPCPPGHLPLHQYRCRARHHRRRAHARYPGGVYIRRPAGGIARGKCLVEEQLLHRPGTVGRAYQPQCIWRR